MNDIPHASCAFTDRAPLWSTDWFIGLAKYLAPWLLVGCALPFVLPWGWNLPFGLLDLRVLGSPVRLGHVLLVIDLILWPSSMLLWDSGGYMPGLLLFPLFWEAVGLNVAIYLIVGLVGWATQNRFRSIFYWLIGLWVGAVLLSPAFYWILKWVFDGSAT